MILPTTGNLLTIAFPPEGSTDADGDPIKSRYFWSNRRDRSAEIAALNAEGWSIYTVLASYVGNERRADHIAGLQAVWADVDLVKFAPSGESYDDTLDHGYTKLLDMVRGHALPMPSTIIESGGGLHIYWGLDAPVDAARWAVLAGKVRLPFRRAFGKAYDGQCTIDSMRLMRTPGYTNPRRGRVAVQAIPTDSTPPALYSYDKLLGAFGDITPTAEELASAVRTGASRTESTAAVGAALAEIGGQRVHAEGSAFAEAQPVERPASWKLLRDGALQGVGCNLLAEVLANGDVGYDVWSGIFSIAKHTDDLDGAITEIAGQWPDWGSRWTHETVRQRIATFAGPRTCASLAEAYQARTGRTPCNGCVHACSARPVKTPLALGYGGRVSLGEDAPAPPPPAAPPAAPSGARRRLVDFAHDHRAMPTRLPLPASTGMFAFERAPDGTSQVVAVTRAGDGEVIRDAVMFPAAWVVCQLRTVDAENNPCYRDLWVVDHARGSEYHELPAIPGISGGFVLAQRLSNMGVRLSAEIPEKQLSAVLGAFIRNQQKDMQTIRNDIRPVISHNGTEDTYVTKSFILGDHIYRDDGHVVRGHVDAGAKREIDPIEPPTQDRIPELIEQWCHHLQACFGPTHSPFGDRNTAARACAALMFGAPLMPMIGAGGDLGGAVMLFTTDSGMGKTTVLRLLLSFYQRQAAFEIADFTAAGGHNKMVHQSTLPVHFNDVHRVLDKNRRGPEGEAESTFLLAVSDQTAKTKATDTREDRKKFRNTYCFLSTNGDLVEKATRYSKSDASLARVLRLPMLSLPEAHRGVTADVQVAFAEFTAWSVANAGKLAHAWVRFLVMNQDRVLACASRWRAKILTDEPQLADSRWRFVVNIIISGLVGAELAEDVGLTPFSATDAYDTLLMAATMGLDRRKELMAEHEAQLKRLVLALVDTTLVRDADATGFDVDARPLRALDARIYPKRGVMAIPRNALGALATKHKLSAGTLVDEIMASGGRVEQLDIADGTPHAVGLQSCLVFNLADTKAATAATSTTTTRS